jgi:hypothetical protein
MEEYIVRVFKNGDKYWYQNDRLHRLDGPAIEYANGAKIWMIKGIQYTEEKFKNIIGH